MLRVELLVRDQTLVLCLKAALTFGKKNETRQKISFEKVVFIFTGAAYNHFPIILPPHCHCTMNKQSTLTFFFCIYGLILKFTFTFQVPIL